MNKYKQQITTQLSKRGVVSFVFASNEESILSLGNDIVKGFGVHASQNIEIATTMTSNLSLATVVIGGNRARLCSGCYQCIKKAVKVRNDCTGLGFCSNECMSAGDDLINKCGTLVDKIHLFGKGEQSAVSSGASKCADTLQLAVMLMYNSISTLASSDLRMALYTALTLEAHPDIAQPALQEASDWLWVTMKALAPELLQSSLVHPNYDWTKDQMFRLLRVIQYNAQPVAVSGVKSASLLCLLPSMCRLNHSCRPNATLSFGIQQQASTTGHNQHRVVVYLHALRDIEADEEVCISYLSQLCASVDTRRELLSQAFHFHCSCQRCTNEVNFCSHSAAQSATSQQSLCSRYLVCHAQLERLIAATATASRDTSSTSAVVSLSHHSAVTALAEQLTGLAINYTVSGDETVVPSVAHDAALTVLHALMTTLPSSGDNVAIGRHRLLVRACLVICACWRLAGGQSSVSRLEFILTCGSYAVELNRLMERNSNGDGPDYQLIRQTIDLLAEAMSLIDKFHLSFLSGSVAVDSAAKRLSGVSGGGDAATQLLESDMSLSRGYFQNLRKRADQIHRTLLQ